MKRRGAKTQMTDKMLPSDYQTFLHTIKTRVQQAQPQALLAVVLVVPASLWCEGMFDNLMAASCQSSVFSLPFFSFSLVLILPDIGTPYGNYVFNVEQELQRKGLRPLRQAQALL